MTIGTCVVTPAKITCTLAGAVDDLSDVHGTLFFWATAMEESTDGSAEFRADNDVVFTVDVPGGEVGQRGQPNVWPDRPFKDGYVDKDRLGAHWGIFATDTMVKDPSGNPVVITDTYDAQLTFDPSTVSVYSSTKDRWTAPNPWGTGVDLPASSFHVVTGGALAANQFQVWIEPSAVQPDTVYVIQYRTTFPPDVVEGQVFGNSIVIPGYSQKSASVVYAGAGGDGAGDALRSIALTKAVSGPAAGDEVFTFSVDCVLASGSAAGFPQTASVQAGETTTFTGVPVGSTCAVDEVDSAGAESVSYDPGSTLVVTKSSPAVIAVTATNTFAPRPVGGLTVSKVVVGDGADMVPAGTEFTVGYSYDDEAGQPVSGDWTFTDGSSQGLDGLPVGTRVILTEAAAPAVDGVMWRVGQFSVDGGAPSATAQVVVGEGTAEVVLTNTAVRLVGDVQLMKNVLGSGAQEVPAGTEYTVGYSYLDDAGEQVSGEWTLENGEVARLTGLAAGTEVLLTEAPAPRAEGVEWRSPVFTVDGRSAGSSTTVVVGDGTTVAVDLTNTSDLLYGDVSLTKELAGDGAAAVPAGTRFTVRYSYTDSDGQAVVGRTGVVVGEVTSLELPAGTEVTFDEVNLPTVPGLVWGAPAVAVAGTGAGQSASVTVPADGTEVAVVVTNTARLVPPVSPTSEPTTPVASTPAATAPARAASGLAHTGAGVVGSAAAGLALLAGGVLLLARRRDARQV